MFFCCQTFGAMLDGKSRSLKDHMNHHILNILAQQLMFVFSTLSQPSSWFLRGQADDVWGSLAWDCSHGDARALGSLLLWRGRCLTLLAFGRPLGLSVNPLECSCADSIRVIRERERERERERAREREGGSVPAAKEGKSDMDQWGCQRL